MVIDMLTMNATQVKQTFGSCLMNVAGEPILIEKSGRPAAVLLSHSEYERLMSLENDLLMAKAVDAIDSGVLSQEEAAQWNDSIIKKILSPTA